MDDLLPPEQRRTVERILSDHAGHDVRLDGADQIRPDDARVLRVLAGDASWIVKRAGKRDDSLFGPWGFFAEWAGGATVTDAAPNVSPAFVGGDAIETLMVFEDVGRGLDVSQVLRGHDRSAAASALTAMGSALGAMHAATASPDVHDAYRRRWRDLCGDRKEPRLRVRAPTLRASVSAALSEAALDLQLDTPDLDDLQDWAYTRHAGWALIHGDPCLDNWILDGSGQPKLIDFQGATFAPAALDAAYARAPFPSCWCVRRIPDELVEHFETAHRAAVAAAEWALSDPATHRQQLAFATAWWFLVQLTWRIPVASREEQPPPGEHLGFRLVSQRDAILLRLRSFLDLSNATGVLASLADQARDLGARLEAAWGEPHVDLYPAFGGAPD